METQIAGSIARMDGSTSQDAIFKDVLAYKEVLAHIMKTCVSEYKDCTIPQIIGYIEPNPQVGQVGPKLTGQITNEICAYWEAKVSGDPLWDLVQQILPGLLTLFGVYVLGAAVRYGNMYLMNNMVSRHYTCAIRIRMSDKIQRLPVKFVDSTPVGQILEQMTDDVSAMGTSIHQIVDTLMQGLLQILTSPVTGRAAGLGETPDNVVLHQDGTDTAHYCDRFGFSQVPEFLEPERAAEVTIPTPDQMATQERISTPRGSFCVTAMSREQMEADGYGFHHASEDGKYLIMANGTQAYAVRADAPEKDNPLRTAEMTLEDDYGMIDGVINNGRRGEELEKAREHAERTQPEKKPSIRERLAAAKQECAKQQPRPAPEKKPPELGER